MNGTIVYQIILWSFLGIGGLIFVALFFVNAPYGRYKRSGWGQEVNNKASWIIMESIAPIGFFLFFLFGDTKAGIMPYVFLLIWMIHYLYRSFVFSSLIRGRKLIPLSVMFFAVMFNGVNTYLQGRYLYHYANFESKYTASWLYSPQFLCGIVIFFAGFIIHTRSDEILRGLRAPGETGYKIPRGWLFRWVSCPNYLGEMIQWLGWAVLTWSVPGLFFALWTVFNLLPRALSHHKWYRANFPDYPEKRKALVPGVL